MRISDWSSDVCSSDLERLLRRPGRRQAHDRARGRRLADPHRLPDGPCRRPEPLALLRLQWALEGMNKAIALDLAPHRIRSNTIAPTFIETPLTKPFLQDTAFRHRVPAKINPGRSKDRRVGKTGVMT